MKSIEEILAANIRSRRKSLKMSQSDLAKKAKISLHTVFRIEKCEQAPRRSNIEAIADALGVSRDSLYIDQSEAQKPTPTVSGLLQALGEMEKELSELKSNPLVRAWDEADESQKQLLSERELFDLVSGYIQAGDKFRQDVFQVLASSREQSQSAAQESPQSKAPQSAPRLKR